RATMALPAPFLRPLLHFPSFHFLDYGLELPRHRRNWLARDAHVSRAILLCDEVERSRRGIFLRKIVSEVSAATLFPLERRTRCRFGDDEQILQVERGVPARVVLTVATHA